MNLLKNKDILNYKDWKKSQNIEIKKNIQNNKLLNLINVLSKLVPRQIHPNILTLFGFCIMIILFYIPYKINLFFGYYYIVISFSIICNLILNNISEYHSINTRQNSIIHKYISDITYNITKKIILYSFLDIIVKLTSYQNIQIIFYNLYTLIYLLWISCLYLKGKKVEIYNLIYLLEKFILCMLSKLITKHTIFSLIFIPDIINNISTINMEIFKSVIVNKYLLYGLPIIYLYNPFISNIIGTIYLIYYIYMISNQLQINIISNPPSIYLPRVYCCGVFDMCHLGHMKLFEKIAKSFEYPIWLIVGVHSDSTVISYKREPIINEKFREESVKLCKYVDEVYPNAELIVTKEFCIEHQIDCVIIGEEYKDNKDKIWYAGGMELQIHKYICRFEPISTTDIIKKIKQYE